MPDRPHDAASIVDWSAAAQGAGRLARPGPQASRDELGDLVDGLRDAASAAVPHVLDVTRMTPAGTARPHELTSDGESQADAAALPRPRRVGAVEPTEHAREVVGLEPLTGVTNLQAGPAVGRARGHECHPPASRRVRDRVVGEIDDDLTQAAPIDGRDFSAVTAATARSNPPRSRSRSTPGHSPSW